MENLHHLWRGEFTGKTLELLQTRENQYGHEVWNNGQKPHLPAANGRQTGSGDSLAQGQS